MGIFDNELILPGTITEIMSDYNFGYDSSKFGTTDSVTIVGTAFNGPVGRAIEVYSPEHAKYIFGDIYDYKTRREATLVAEILDAWDRGCRTIYAVRVSGQPIFKDFQLAIDTNLKLRVSGIFPSNDNKEVYMVYDNSANAEKIKIYKPSNRATIQEKLQGAVDEDESILVTTLDLSGSYSIGRGSRLVEAIKIINDHPYNNVIRLSIVDEEGNDVTIASKEAQSLSFGVMFGGAYFLGRNQNNALATTNLNFVFTTETDKPYESFEGTLFKRLTMNTDINKDLPIYGTNVAKLNEKFVEAGVSMTTMFDILQIPGMADKIYGKDEIDYEEVDISGFDLYERLGSGFAVTAKAEFKGAGGDIKVKETAASDENRIKAIPEGIYSMLQNLKSDYRILASGEADQVVSGKLPRKTDFQIARANEYSIFNDKIIATPKIDKKSVEESKSYSFHLDYVPSGFGSSETIKPLLYTEQTIQLISKANSLDEIEGKQFENGSLFLVIADVLGVDVGTLYRYTNGKIEKLDNSKNNSDLIGKLFLVEDKIYVGSENASKIEFEEAPITFANVDGIENKYILVESAETVSVYEIEIIPEDVEAVLEAYVVVNPIGGIDEVFSDNEDKTLITIQSKAIGENKITIKSSALDYTTLEEFIEILNEDKDIRKFFSFVISNDSYLEKDEYIIDEIETKTGLIPLPSDSAKALDRTVTYDTTLYIPYKTTDNFARQLAQHCTYTSLKTASTHGIIGCSKIVDVNLNTVASKVDSLLDLDLNLYAKKPNGRDMLDRNNLPYTIGRNISVVFGQYVISPGIGYNYISGGAAGYAGMISVLPLDQSSTAQPINIPQPMFELTNYQLERLTQKGFVTFKQSYTRGLVVSDGITMAPVTSPFRRLSVSRIIGAMEEIIRSAVEPFIGKQNHLANRNSMQTAIRSGLDKIKGKLIEAYEFQMTVDTAMTKLGIIEIDYRVVPIYEIREVRNRISVKESL